MVTLGWTKTRYHISKTGPKFIEHYTYGGIADWMYSKLARINNSDELNETGYKKIILKPHFENSYV